MGNTHAAYELSSVDLLEKATRSLLIFDTNRKVQWSDALHANVAFLRARVCHSHLTVHRCLLQPQPVSRGDALLRVATTCVGGGSVWSFAAIAASAKAPVMKLPEGGQ